MTDLENFEAVFKSVKTITSGRFVSWSKWLPFRSFCHFGLEYKGLLQVQKSSVRIVSVDMGDAFRVVAEIKVLQANAVYYLKACDTTLMEMGLLVQKSCENHVGIKGISDEK